MIATPQGMRRLELRSISENTPDLAVTATTFVLPEMLTDAEYRAASARECRRVRNALCTRERGIDGTAEAWREAWFVFLDDDSPITVDW